MPDVPAYFLSERDRAQLQALFADWARRQQNTQNRPAFHGPDAEEWLAPEVYVALTPPKGIMSVGFEPGTATATADFTDVPIFSGECQVYQVINEASLGTSTGTGIVFDGSLVPVDAMHPVDVFNYLNVDLPGGVWILVSRDKFGTWFALSGGSSNGIKGSDVSFIQIIDGPESGIPGDVWQGYILHPVPGSTGFFTPSGSDKCWVWNPMQQKLTPGKPYLGLANGNYSHGQAPGTGTGVGPPVTLPLYIVIGGWLTNVACVSSQIQQTRF